MESTVDSNKVEYVLQLMHHSFFYLPENLLQLIDGKMERRNMVGSTANLMRLINKFHHEVNNNWVFGVPKEANFLTRKKGSFFGT